MPSSPGRRTPKPPRRQPRGGAASRPAPAPRSTRASTRAKGASRAAGPRRPQTPEPRPHRELPALERWLADELHQKAARHRRADAKRLMQELLAAVADGDAAEALRLAERAKGAAPHAPSVREALGLILYDMEEYRRALAELQAFRRMTGDRSHDPRIAGCYLALGRPEKAVEVVEDVGPGDVDEATWIDALVVRAEAMGEMGNLEGAVAVLSIGPLEAREIHDRHRRLWYAFADMLERAGRASEAQKWFRRLAVDDPDFGDVAERAAR